MTRRGCRATLPSTVLNASSACWLVKRHFPESAEVHLMAVDPRLHRQQIGRSLVEAAEADLAADGVRYLQVKTLGPSRADANYANTREFYLALGFVPIEEFLTLWNEGNPCLLLVKALAPGSHAASADPPG
jgi:ribosomal protein S18 acetylase RimI-like enzyme